MIVMKRTGCIAATLLIAAVASTGCAGSSGRERRVVGSGASTSEPVAAPSSVASTTTVARVNHNTPPAEALSGSSRLRIDGVGPIDVGMTVEQAGAAAGVELAIKSEPYCDVLTATPGPAGLALIVTAPATGRIEVVIVKGGPVRTLSGIGIGSTETEVKAAYTDRLRSANPSLPVHRLIYQAVDPALSDRVLVFVIDNSRVAAMYAGAHNQAEADEICG